MTQARLIELTFDFETDEDGFVNAFCEPLGIVSCGRTTEEAWAMIKDAVETEINGLIDAGTIEAFLEERNVKSFIMDNPIVQQPDVKPEFQTRRIEGVTRVPAYAR